MLCCFFTSQAVTDYATAASSSTQAFSAYFQAMLKAGIYLPPSQYEANFVSAAHDESTIKATCQAANGAFAAAIRMM
jgi:glutamate-1-semialdehyde 2,1-aminomutase